MNGDKEYKVEMFFDSQELDVYLDFIDNISSSEKFKFDLKKLMCLEGANIYWMVYQKMLNSVKTVEVCDQ